MVVLVDHLQGGCQCPAEADALHTSVAHAAQQLELPPEDALKDFFLVQLDLCRCADGVLHFVSH